MAELKDVIQQLKENNESTIDTTQAVDSLANQIGRMYAQDAAKELEASRELYWEAYEDDPIWNITARDNKEQFDRTGRINEG